MENNCLVSVKSNCNFRLDYATGRLQPETEIIIITSNAKYVIDKKQTSINKEQEVKEYRFKSGLAGINQLIGELQLVVQNMNVYDQMSGSLNTIIQSLKNKTNETTNSTNTAKP